MVPMRDGTKLATYILLPSGGKPVPTILIRSVYKDGAIPWSAFSYQKYLDAGYAYVFQSTRGTGASEGTFRFIADDRNDGYDTVEWIARQAWSDGNVGMNNGSYLGMTQLAAAAARPPHLKAIVPHVPTADLFRETPYSGGIFMRYHMLNWHKLISISSREELGVGFLNPTLALQDESVVQRLMSRPLVDSGNGYLEGDRLSQYRAFIENPVMDDYWSAMQNQPEHYGNMDLAVLVIGGSFDPSVGTLTAWKGLEDHAPEPSRRHLLIGPWAHAQTYHAGVTGNAIREFGDQALVDMDALRIAFYDRYLKNDQSREQLPNRVKLFVTGSNVWREFNTYPPRETREVNLFLSSQGDANGVSGSGRLTDGASDGERDRFISDPENPVVSILELATGITFYQETEQRDDVLVYSSDVLDTPLTILGEPKVRLQVSATTPDADVILRLTEVFPDGRSVALGKGGELRLRYREGFNREVMLEPGEIYSVDVPLTYIAHTVPAGNRLRLNILGTEFPLLDPNPNTGGSIGEATSIQPTTVSIHHDRLHPSFLTLPVLDLDVR